MPFNPDIHHRRSIRLRGYDYAQAGVYFVTICSQDRRCLFGRILEDDIQRSAVGEMIQSVWDAMPAYYPGIDVAEFVVMPNHVHGIIVIVGATACGCPDLEPARRSGQAPVPAPTVPVRLSLPDVVHRFKTMTTKRYADGVKQLSWPPFPGRLWQRNYWEHVVRDEADYLRISEYIQHNPARWAQDSLNPLVHLENSHLDKRL